MIREKSAGVIVYRRHPEEGLQFLVLYHRGSYWNFPKGKLEAGESEMDAALRELREEAGIERVRLVDGFRQQTQFFFKETRGGKTELIKKDVALYLAEAGMDTAVKISREHNGYAWLDAKQAAKFLKFKSLKEIIAAAESALK